MKGKNVAIEIVLTQFKVNDGDKSGNLATYTLWTVVTMFRFDYENCHSSSWTKKKYMVNTITR